MVLFLARYWMMILYPPCANLPSSITSMLDNVEEIFCGSSLSGVRSQTGAEADTQLHNFSWHVNEIDSYI